MTGSTEEGFAATHLLGGQDRVPRLAVAGGIAYDTINDAVTAAPGLPS